MKKLKENKDLRIFRDKYKDISGSLVPIEYLEKSDVYAFIRKGKIIGGFVLGKNLTLRTIEAFCSPDNQKEVFDKLNYDNNYCEVCCFWVERAYRKKLWANIMFWFHMCYTTASQEKPYLLFGTNVKGLAIVYGGPRKSVLFHTDVVEERNTYVFLARRKDLMGGLVELVFQKLFKLRKVREITPKTELLKTISYELSL